MSDYSIREELNKELETLRAQLAASADEQNRLNAVAHDQFMQLVAKDAELAQCRQDADRYRWLKAWNKTDGFDEVAIDREIAVDAAIQQPAAPDSGKAINDVEFMKMIPQKPDIRTKPQQKEYLQEILDSDPEFAAMYAHERIREELLQYVPPVGEWPEGALTFTWYGHDNSTSPCFKNGTLFRSYSELPLGLQMHWREVFTRDEVMAARGES